MYKLTKYCCDICDQEYLELKEAKRCEETGFPEETAHIKEGDEIEFSCEVTLKDSTIPTYIKMKGTVLHKGVVFIREEGGHKEIIVCAVKGHEDTVKEDHERGVFMINIKHEGKTLFSPSFYKYHIGYAKHLKDIKENDTRREKIEG